MIDKIRTYLYSSQSCTFLQALQGQKWSLTLISVDFCFASTAEAKYNLGSWYPISLGYIVNGAVYEKSMNNMKDKNVKVFKNTQ